MQPLEEMTPVRSYIHYLLFNKIQNVNGTCHIFSEYQYDMSY